MMREFYQRPSGMAGTNGQLLLGAAMIGTGIFSMAVTGMGGMPIGVGILLLIVAYWAKGNPLFRFHDDHVEMKFAALAPRRRVLYREIDAVVVESAKKAFLSTSGKKIRLPVAALEDHERDELLELLNSHANGSQRAQPAAAATH